MKAPKPVLTYRCIEGGCGNLMAGVFVDDRPLLAHNEENSQYRQADELEQHAAQWVDPEELTPGPLREWQGIRTGARFGTRPVEISCRRHGRWSLSKTEILSHYEIARAGGRPDRGLSR